MDERARHGHGMMRGAFLPTGARLHAGLALSLWFILCLFLLIPAEPGTAGETDATDRNFIWSRTLPEAPPPPGTLRFATLEWPPYISPDIPDNGYVANILREIFIPAGYKLELVYLPWQRAVHSLQDPSIAGYLPEYYSQELENGRCLLSEGFPGGPITFLFKQGRIPDFSTLQALRSYRIGVVEGYVNYRAFDQAQYLTKDYATDDVSNLRKLLAGRVDLIIGDPLVLNYLYSQQQGGNTEPLSVLHPYPEMKQFHICFNPKYDNAEQLRALFSEGLAETRASGRLQELHDAAMQTYMPTLIQGAERPSRTPAATPATDHP